MRLLAACLAGWLAWCPAVLAACAGASILDKLAQSDPAAHAAILDQAGRIANPEGRFWRVERPGVEHSHLFGTFHTDQAVATVPEPVWQALAGARIALFELSRAEQAKMQARVATDPNFAFDLAAPPLSRRLAPDDLAVITEALAARGIPLAQAERMRPWLLFTLLGFPACHLQALAAGAAPLDRVMLDRAAGAGVPDGGLETHEQALAAFQSIGPDRFLAMLVETSALLDREEDVFRTTLDLYADGRLATIDAFGRWLAAQPPGGPDSAALYGEVMEALLATRNRAWLGPLEAELDRSRAFVAVGALHLPGEEGLVALLRERGWTLTRLD